MLHELMLAVRKQSYAKMNQNLTFEPCGMTGGFPVSFSSWPALQVLTQLNNKQWDGTKRAPNMIAVSYATMDLTIIGTTFLHRLELGLGSLFFFYGWRWSYQLWNANWRWNEMKTYVHPNISSRLNPNDSWFEMKSIFISWIKKNTGVQRQYVVLNDINEK